MIEIYKKKPKTIISLGTIISLITIVTAMVQFGDWRYVIAAEAKAKHMVIQQGLEGFYEVEIFKLNYKKEAKTATPLELATLTMLESKLADLKKAAD